MTEEECDIFAAFASFNNSHLGLSGLNSKKYTFLCVSNSLPFITAHFWKVVGKKKI